jgi:hypothetical protein
MFAASYIGRTLPSSEHFHLKKNSMHLCGLWASSAIFCWEYFCKGTLLKLCFFVLATRPKVRGFKPGRGRWIFKGDKNP